MSVLKSDKLSEEMINLINYEKYHGRKNDYSFRESEIIRRDNSVDNATIMRPGFSRDIDKILHSVYYNRYTDKTQVFSFYKNDDITRRALHVQLVSRIARNIGSVLGLNLDLIEAISLGHDIGHTPFGHAGEKYLSEIYYSNTERYFNHNVHSVRVLDSIIPYNISLQTLDGILAHNGEFELKEYKPQELKTFNDFDNMIENCYIDEKNIKKIIPSTLEGCVVRVCDMIAYIGKDRQDAVRANLISNEDIFAKSEIGKINAEIINNLVVNIVENSYGKNYIKLDEEHYEALKQAKKQNYELLYLNKKVANKLKISIKPMMFQLYKKLLVDIKSSDKTSIIFKHHIDLINEKTSLKYKRNSLYENSEPNQIVVDYIASMTDDYFVDLYEYLFPKSKYRVDYVSYFSNCK